MYCVYKQQQKNVKMKISVRVCTLLPACVFCFLFPRTVGALLNLWLELPLLVSFSSTPRPAFPFVTVSMRTDGHFKREKPIYRPAYIIYCLQNRTDLFCASFLLTFFPLYPHCVNLGIRWKDRTAISCVFAHFFSFLPFFHCACNRKRMQARLYLSFHACLSLVYTLFL